jgi:hypothetical protein
MTDLLEQHLSRLANPIDDSDWLDVRRRARLRRARPLVALVAAAAVVSVLVAMPGFGLGSRLLDLIEGSPAPPPVQTHFAANDALREQLFAHARAAGHVLHDQFSSVIPEQARGVAAIESSDGPVYLWVAPTQDGRHCWLIQTGAAPGDGRPYGTGSCDGSDGSRTISPSLGWTIERPNVRIIHVRVYDPEITSVDLENGKGGRVTLPVTSGHALGTVRFGWGVEAFVGRDREGVERATFRLKRRSETP